MGVEGKSLIELEIVFILKTIIRSYTQKQHGHSGVIFVYILLFLPTIVFNAHDEMMKGLLDTQVYTVT